MNRTLRFPASLLGLMLLAACGAAPGPTTPADDQPVPPSPITDARSVSAREHLDAAAAAARAVAADAALVRVDSQRGADFEAHVPADGLAPHWLYSFASRSESLEINVTASTLGAQVINRSPIAAETISPLPANWADSTAAFQAAQGNGGSEYLASRRTTPVYFGLAMDMRSGEPRWTLRYSVNPRNGLLFFVIDGRTGEFLEKQETQPETGE